MECGSSHELVAQQFTPKLSDLKQHARIVSYSPVGGFCGLESRAAAGWPWVASAVCAGGLTLHSWMAGAGQWSPSAEEIPRWFTSGHRGGPGGPQCASAFQAFACVPFVVILLVKASTRIKR